MKKEELIKRLIVSADEMAKKYELYENDNYDCKYEAIKMYRGRDRIAVSKENSINIFILDQDIILFTYQLRLACQEPLYNGYFYFTARPHKTDEKRSFNLTSAKNYINHKPHKESERQADEIFEAFGYAIHKQLDKENIKELELNDKEKRC